MNSILSATVLIPLIVIVLLIVLLCVGYVKAPPDMAYIISGVKKKSKVVIGKASIRIPFFERLDKLNLRLIPDRRQDEQCRADSGLHQYQCRCDRQHQDQQRSGEAAACGRELLK